MYVCIYLYIYIYVCVCANMYIMYLLCSVVCRHIHASHMYQPSQAMEVAGRGASVRSLSINHIVSWVGTYPLPIYLSQFPNETECGLLVVDVLVSAQVASFFGDVVSPPTEIVRNGQLSMDHLCTTLPTEFNMEWHFIPCASPRQAIALARHITHEMLVT